MAFVTCPDCKNRISKLAKLCPHCGRPNKPKAEPLRALGGFLVLTMLVIMCSGLITGSGNSGPALNADGTPSQHPSQQVRPAKLRSNIHGAWVMAQKFLERDYLTSPSTASYCGFGEQAAKDVVTPLGNGEYRVRGWVDAQNAFGVTVRTDFSMLLRDKGDGKWELIGEPKLRNK